MFHSITSDGGLSAEQRKNYGHAARVDIRVRLELAARGSLSPSINHPMKVGNARRPTNKPLPEYRARRAL